VREFHSITKFLEERNTPFQVLVHDPAYTSEEAARARNASLRTGIKALVFLCDRNPILVVVRGDHKADRKKLRKATHTRDIRLASPEEVKRVSNCEIGAVHPLGPLMSVWKTVMDESILENTRVNFSPGLHTHTINMPAQALVSLAEPVIADIAESD